MDFARRWMAQIQAQLSELSISAKLLIGTLAVMVPLVLLIVVQYASSPQLAPLLDQPMAAEQRYQLTAALRERGIDHEVVGDRVMVPRDRQSQLLAEMQMMQVLPEDTARGFDALVEKQTWWQSSEQNRQMMLIAKQNVLSRVVRAYPSVHDATVILSMPRNEGFAATHKQPTASVNVMLSGGARLDQKQVDAIAGLVSGAVAEMRPEDVTVIDAAAGQQWTVRKEDEVIPGDYLEILQQQEGYVRTKLSDTLRYIPEVIVAVNVEVDLTRKEIDEMRYDQDTSLELLTDERREQTQTQRAGGEEPGVRANAGANLGGGGGGGDVSTTESTESSFAPFAGRTHELSASPGGVPTRISATINVPRSYFVNLFMQGQDEDAPQPTDEALEPLIEEHTERIQRQVEPLVAAREIGEVVVDVYPDAGPRVEMDTAQAGAGGALVDSGLVRPIGLGVLALVSIGMMLMMVRKASQKPAPPSVQELAGVPPRVETEIDMVGEVDETDSALDGMELDEDTLRHRKVAEQVSEMIKANPSDVARIMSRWARTEG